MNTSERGTQRPDMLASDGKDLELLERWAAGDIASANELIDRHCSTLHRYFSNKVGDELEDLVQQTFLACIEAIPRYRAEASFRSFLLGIARIQLYRHYARRHRDAAQMSVTSLRDPCTSPSGSMARREDAQQLSAGLQQIPLEAQEILELAFWEGLSCVEIAAVLAVPLNTVYSRLHRAKLALREHLERSRLPARVRPTVP